VNFVESMVQGYSELSRVPLEQARVLDYGCGWGRLMRLMYSHVDPAQLYGCDPWDKSLQICRDANMQGQFALCDYVPEQIPFENSFELIYAFSVFTHLSQKTADAVMAALRKAIAPNGVLLITVRPQTYWDVAPLDDANRARLRKLHMTEGFAFVPHQRETVDGEVTYGDTSMTNDYIEQRWQDWRIVKTAINERDPLQRLVFLLPK
jgi:trans-aconitate methyltransferase